MKTYAELEADLLRKNWSNDGGDLPCPNNDDHWCENWKSPEGNDEIYICKHCNGAVNND